MMRITATALSLVLGCASSTAAAQQREGAVRLNAVRVFLDCDSHCDVDYLRNAIVVVNYVRDRNDADVHVLITSETTGGGGTVFTVSLFGLGRFADVNQTVRFTVANTATEDERRAGLLEVLKRGLVRYVSDTPLADSISISFLPIGSARRPAVDAWNLWVFSVNASGSAGGERSSRGGSVRGSVSANRTTDTWKMTLFASSSYRADTFQLDEEDFKSISRSVDGSALLV